MLEPPSSLSGFPWPGALPYLSAAATGLLGFFGAQFTAVARLQKTLLDASRRLVDESQRLHALDGARILELEAVVFQMRGEAAQHIQTEQSMQRIIDRLRAELDGRP